MTVTNQSEVMELIRRALAEDIGRGDVTTLALVPAERVGKAIILSRGGPYVVSGLDVARSVFRAVDQRLQCDLRLRDGDSTEPNQALFAVQGPVRGILSAERTALNFLQRMTGIATLTREFVTRTQKYGSQILDTRKTTPTLRTLEKYAVVCGGGRNHRMGLDDMILIKDNHRRVWASERGGALFQAIEAARRQYPGIAVEIEVESEAELADALQGKPDWILLDNMSPETLRRCVERCAKRCKLEASGGITLANVETIASTGVDAISIGALTHSAPAADLALELV